MTPLTAPVPLRAAKPDALVANVLDAWDGTSEDQRARGAQWYRVANQLARQMAGGDARTGAGVIAALSAQASWERNTRDAAALLAGRPVLNTRERLAKAHRILAGEDPDDVLPRGLKTWHFYRCIADPDDAAAVVIDRHAHDLAVGRRLGTAYRGLGYRPRYDLFAGAYRAAAGQLGVLPSTLQAATWLAWTEDPRRPARPHHRSTEGDAA
ncbi:hypothetical protein [Streptomyces sp. NPDC093261]|uniref:DUF7178 family protein n=1 Tax=Streptomyces sp. NPDC093261 TaxID=3366037 RepID=UPI003810972B